MDTFDIIIIGAGPGGYSAALYASKLGYKIALIDEQENPGGTCLNEGCIPSKTLLVDSLYYAKAQSELKKHGVIVSNVSFDLSSMMNRKERVVRELARGIHLLLEQAEVVFIQGTASFTAKDAVKIKTSSETHNLTATKGILIATGSTSAMLPNLEQYHTDITLSTDLLSYSTCPSQMLIIGSGAIGIELGCIWQRLGAKLTVVEYLPRIIPSVDAELASSMMKFLQRQGIKFILNSTVKSIDTVDQTPMKNIIIENNTDHSETTIQADCILLSVGRKPNTEHLNLDVIGLKTNAKNQIVVDNSFMTSVQGIWAIGDVIPGPMLAHKAEYDARLWADGLKSQRTQPVSYDRIPAVIYTSPEVASVGATEEQAIAKYGTDNIKIGKALFSANGRTKADGNREGFVKLIADSEQTLLGAHILGEDAGNMISIFTPFIGRKDSVELLSKTVYPHPTTSETLQAALSDLVSKY